MSDYMVYWKYYERDTNEAGLSAIDDDWHSKNERIYRQLRQGDNLWVIVRYGEKEWRLAQKISVSNKKIDTRYEKFEVQEYGKYHVMGDPIKSKRFDIITQVD